MEMERYLHNFTNLLHLVTVDLRKALLNLLHNVDNSPKYKGLSEDPILLYKELQNLKVKLQPLKNQKVIGQKQWSLLFPKSKQTDNSKFDITLIFLLLRAGTDFGSPYEWSYFVGMVGHCQRAVEFRNTIFHYGDFTSISESQYQQYLAEGESILKDLGYKRSAPVINPVDFKKLLISYFDASSEVFQQLVEKDSACEDLASEIMDFKTSLKSYHENITDCDKTMLSDLFKKYGRVCQRCMKEIDKLKCDRSKIVQAVQEIERDVHCLKEDVAKLTIDSGELSNEFQNLKDSVQKLDADMQESKMRIKSDKSQQSIHNIVEAEAIVDAEATVDEELRIKMKTIMKEPVSRLKTYLLKRCLDQQGKEDAQAVAMHLPILSESDIKSLERHNAGGGSPALSFIKTLCHEKRKETISGLKEKLKKHDGYGALTILEKYSKQDLLEKLTPLDKVKISEQLTPSTDMITADWRDIAEEYNMHERIPTFEAKIMSENSYSRTQELLRLIDVKYRNKINIGDFLCAVNNAGNSKAKDVILEQIHSLAEKD